MVTFFNKKIIAVFFGLLMIVSCSEKKPQEPRTFTALNGEQIVLYLAEFSDIKKWKKDDFAEIIEAFNRSCEKILQQKTEFLYNTAIKIPTVEYQRICINFADENIKTSRQMKNFLEDNFSPWLVTQNNSAEGKFTAYYQAEIRASETRDEVYKYPIFGKPDDLVMIDMQKFDQSLPKLKFFGRVQDGELLPYYTRAEIENNPQITENYPVLLWGDSETDIFIMQIQGSALAKLPDGKFVSIAYAGNNGQKFQGIGSILLAHNKLESGKASMGEIKKWLEENSDEAKEYMKKNDRYVFHRISDKVGAVGAQEVILTPQRSLAVDRGIIPLGSLLWLETTAPDKSPLEKVVIAQDTGGAIKGAVRGDYFWGYGDEALQAAGKMNSAGRYYILMPKEDE